jgi:predicted CXXCH cytochrome family protein
LWVGGIVGASVCAALFLAGLAAKERDNRFCVACHLHDEKFSRLTDTVATDLAGSHHGKKAEVGCIACHGGADPAMQLKVWALAGFDTLRFLAGTYAEPTRMRLQLRDLECRQCHRPILGSRASQPARPGAATLKTDSASTTSSRAIDPGDESTFAAEAATEGRGGTSYHAIREHDTVRTACVRCHTSHTTDGEAEGRFIAKARVLPICRGCHKEL